MHHNEYYEKLDQETQKIDDFSWLEVMEGDSRVPKEEVEAMRKSLINKWGTDKI